MGISGVLPIGRIPTGAVLGAFSEADTCHKHCFALKSEVHSTHPVIEKHSENVFTL